VTLEIEQATVRFGPILAVNGVSLTVAAGERLAVLGPSGSGKSTLLRAIAGLEPLSAGRVCWAGADMAGMPPHERNFGLMFQDYLLFPHRDVAGNVAFGLRMRHIPAGEVERRVAEVLELVDLGGYQRRAVTELSGGEQQRVALARALAPTPRLLMLDEPLGALDRSLRTRLLDELGQLFERLSLPIVYVTHDQQEALAIGDRVALMRDGELDSVATPEDLWHAPPSEFAARFLGFDNICSAHVDERGRAATPWGSFPAPAGLPPGDHRLLVLPDALRPAPDGDLPATVLSTSFRGDHTRLTVRVEGRDAPPLTVVASFARQPPVGSAISLALAPGGIVALP
jgi:thiamine transport system ATP-binding protein